MPQWDIRMSRRKHKQETVPLLQLLLPTCYFDSISSIIVKTQPSVTHTEAPLKGTEHLGNAPSCSSSHALMHSLNVCSAPCSDLTLTKKQAAVLWDQNSISLLSVRMGYSLLLRAELVRKYLLWQI